MGWFKDLLGTSNWQAAAPTSTAASGPLGMAQGKGVRFDSTLALLLDGSTSVRVPFDQAIWSAGWVDLGQSNKLHRYYMNDEDFWVQIHVTGDDQVESVTLFNYLSYVTVNSDAELQRLAGPNSLIGLPAYSHQGVEYLREWGTEQGQTDQAVGAGQALQFGVTVHGHVAEVVEQGDRFDLVITGDVDLYPEILVVHVIAVQFVGLAEVHPACAPDRLIERHPNRRRTVEQQRQGRVEPDAFALASSGPLAAVRLAQRPTSCWCPANF